VDLSVSPDIEAYICYAIVFFLGAVTAVIQINRALGNLGGVWLIPRTWLLFLMYLMVPVALFWFLDRTSAITDTSLFAAALVGVGYAGIMNGTNKTIPATSLAQLWTPFQAYADEVQKAVLQRTKRNEDRLMDGLVTSVIADPARYAPLESLALRFSPDAAALRARLAAIVSAAAPAVAAPAAGIPPAAGPAAAAPGVPPAANPAPAAAAQSREVLEDKTRLLFTELVKVPDAFYLMRNRGIITEQVYWLDVKGMRRVSQYLLVLVPLIVVLAYTWPLVRPAFTNLPSDYYSWRLVKTNATPIEQNRARLNLLTLMRDSASSRAATTENITQVLRQPGLSIERIDLLLQSLLESRTVPDGNADLPMRLVASLRSASVDARTRINDVLKYLAETGCSAKFVEENVWKPSDGDSTVSLENRIRTWTNFWNSQCGKKPSASENAGAQGQPAPQGSPAASDKPAAPGNPANQDKPATPDKPANQDKPAATDKPASQDKPAATDKPASPDKPAAPDKPANQDKPATTDKPTSPDKPAATDKSANPDKPAAADKPANPDKPPATDKPTSPDKPAAPGAHGSIGPSPGRHSGNHRSSAAFDSRGSLEHPACHYRTGRTHHVQRPAFQRRHRFVLGRSLSGSRKNAA
jgi:hypothetical protein